MTSPPRQTFQISLDTFEAVISGGVQRVTWKFLCDKEDEWVPAKIWPDTQFEDVERSSRMVWQQRISVRLPEDARLLRVESRPAPRQRRDPLTYLVGTRNNSKTRTVRTEFRVTRSGQLERQARKPSV